MRLPRSNRKTWALAGVLVVIAAAVAAYAIHELGKPGNTYHPNVAFNTGATTSTTPAKHVNNFAVPFYGNQETRTRTFTAIRSLHPPFKLAWKFGGNALLEFPATIWGNNLYLMDDGATVKRVNIKTGKQIWERHMGTCKGCGLSASSPSLDVAHKELFVSVLSLKGSTIGAVGGELAAVSMRSGKTLWRFPVASGTESSPMVVGNSVYFGDQAGTEYSLNIKTGHENWSFATGGSIKAGAAYYKGQLFFGNYAGDFYAVNASSGKPTWTASPGGEFYSTPAVAYGRVYVGNNNGDAYSFGISNGAIAWSRSLGGYVYSGPAVADTPGLGPTVYIGSYDSHLYALNARTGATEWQSPYLPAKSPGISGSATVVNNTVYVSTVYSPGSYGFNARTGGQDFAFPDGSYTTVIADRHALFLMGKYVLYKFVPHNAKLPKLRHKKK
ncbi:MAG: PQQ-like beta-propeller repeat protein [Acidobacteriota bacterium]|nr:PQQ-like beta-propeller repeat protein [Acidobacteriota bacterium]